MVKADMSRDYYADLELPPTADIADIKKQYRKLALKWHPDRNVGHEEEVRPRFVVIQEAMEVLSDPNQKQKFDANRKRTSRYPTASGVKGNPWQDVSSRFQPPPRRAAPTARQHTTTSGASRYAQSSWVPPPNKSSKDYPNEHAKAWDRMRPSSSGGKATAGSSSSQQQSPRRATRNFESQSMPRTAAQKQRAEASFGNATRRTGFVPSSPLGDEPPVSNSHYFTTKTHTNIFEVASAAAAAKKAAEKSKASDPVDPLSHQFAESILDERQSTPYANNVGEKTNPFDGASLNRAKTVRDAFRKFHEHNAAGGPTPQRPRSASVGGDSSPNPRADEHSSNSGLYGNAKLHPDSAAQKAARPRGPEIPSAPTSAAFVDPHSSSSSVNSTKANAGGQPTSQAQNGPSVYAPSPQTPSLRHQKYFRQAGLEPLCTTADVDVGVDGTKTLSPDQISYLFSQPLASPPPVSSGQREESGKRSRAREDYAVPKLPLGHGQSEAPSASHQSKQARPPKQSRVPEGLNAFNREIHITLERLINGKRKQHLMAYRCGAAMPPSNGIPKASINANSTHSDSFTFNVQDDTFERTSQNKPHPFMRSSVDNINTKFADGENADNYQFNAGGPSEDDEFLAAKRRYREGGARGRQSPARSDSTSNQAFSNQTMSTAQESEAAQKQAAFDAQEWAEKFGPHHFVPTQPSRSSSSPTRRGIKKPKSVKMTAGTAGMVDDEETSSEERTRVGTAANINGAASPMDIDDPPQEPAAQPASSARNIPVEPTRKEWRAGDVNGATPVVVDVSPAHGVRPTKSFKGNAVGSEDSEEFLRTDMFAHTEPFARPAAGLSSFGDMKSSLPFQSKPSAKLPIKKEKAKALDFPHAPLAPRPPPVLAISGLRPAANSWAKYVREFNVYMIHWAEFNGRVTDHFAARRRQVDETQKTGGFDWIGSLGDSGIEEYLQWLEEDRIVRQKWMAACESHELTMREFQKHRLHMKQ